METHEVPKKPQEFAVASISIRLVNYILDRIFSQIFIVLATVILSTFIFQGGLDAIAYIILFQFILYIAYFLITETVWQRSVAKFITGTKVVMVDGSKPPFKNILGRTFARIIPFEAFSFLFSSYPTGWHDSLSGTIVVPQEYTVDDVKKIDIEKLRKESGTNYAGIIIGIIAALFIGIAIIGILSSVVLASLNTARMKAKDAQVKSSIAQILPLAEIYFDKNKNYSNAGSCGEGMFKDPNIQQILTNTQSDYLVCIARGSSYAISAILPSNQGNWCIDNKNYGINGVAQTDGNSAGCTAQ